MFKVGDKVALRKSPHVLLGVIDVCTSTTVRCGPLPRLFDGSLNTSRETPEDFVPYEPLEKTHYLVCQQPAVPYYNSLEEAQAKVKELLSARPNSAFAIYRAEELHKSEVTINVKKLG